MTTPPPRTTASSIAVRQPLARTRSEQVEDRDHFHVRTAELRDTVADLATDVTELHEASQEIELGRLTQGLESTAPVELLDELANDLGFPWAVLARALGVSPAAVRKWRRGAPITPAFHQNLAEFVAFCRVLVARDPRITDPAHWLEMPVAPRADVTRLDLYVDGLRASLLDLAAERVAGERILDEADASWRDRAARSGQWRVLEHEDGSTSIVPSTDSA